MTLPSKMTVVTSPDLHLEPNAHRIVIVDHYQGRVEIQDAIGDNWPNRDTVVYHVESTGRYHMDWAFFQLKVANTVIINITGMWDWFWPVLMDIASSCDIFYVIADDTPQFETLKLTMQITNPDRVFMSREAAVLAAAART